MLEDIRRSVAETAGVLEIALEEEEEEAEASAPPAENGAVAAPAEANPAS